MMRQFLEIKTANPDCLLFYRMGDFYELFFEDAETASRALGITLTTRGKHLGDDIPMCGVPVHAADDYLQRLIALGHRVAVCEQLEDPAEARKRGSKSVVRRDVVRLVTPGTLTEDNLLDSRRNNFLAALARTKAAGDDGFALAWADISTGEFGVAEAARLELPALIARVEPGELLVSDALYDDPALRNLLRETRAAVTPLPPAVFDSTSAERRLRDYFSVATLDGFGPLTRAETAAAGAVVSYVDRTQVGGRPPLSPPIRETRGAVMAIDPATRANLELVTTLSGDRRGSLAAAVDRTVTAAGGRELTRRLASPLTDHARIAARHEAVAWLVDNAALRRTVREVLRSAPDMARSRARIAVGRGGPRDLAAIRDGIAAAHALAGHLGEVPDAEGPDRLADIAGRLRAPQRAVHAELAAALVDAPPHLRRDGGFVKAGFAAELDQARDLRDESRKIVAGLQAKYQDDTGVRSLKIRHNNVLGYFVEVTAQHAGKLTAEPNSQTFFHRQTLASQMRFSTGELADLEGRIATAAERALALEMEIFDALVARVVADGEALDAASAALGELDVHAGFAELAVSRDYVRPVMSDDLAFDIHGGRHAVVEQALAGAGDGPFVANDCDLSPPQPGDGSEADGGRILLVTGPNMAGKSTFLRQNALIAVLAQAGSFVPAESARIGIVDRLFSRVGAADDLARGRSTFMVEMVETAAILNQAGPRSLVILDEIGRGTATFDGLSIAWATIEHLHDVNRCRSLFATHFHELTALSETQARLSNATVRVKEWKGDVVFLHEVVPGAADRSYGVQVAKLAGLPAAVVSRAREVLHKLEETDRNAGAAGIVDDLPLFASHVRRAAAPAAAAGSPSVLAERLAAVTPDDLTPLQALELLYELKALAANQAADPAGGREQR
ncbi:DNA mismatch repair protein MutS [Microbaculum marinum]|uniref:DNA mismatch repair protein MutS n=2 Tax=Microbaculum marinum TaxID=1764581 RepID=A0AAW9RGE2_9HYPH